jgi:hypothetical protein
MADTANLEKAHVFQDFDKVHGVWVVIQTRALWAAPLQLKKYIWR